MHTHTHTLKQTNTDSYISAHVSIYTYICTSYICNSPFKTLLIYSIKYNNKIYNYGTCTR